MFVTSGRLLKRKESFPMEDIQAVDIALSAEPSPDLPEALQAPTRQVGRGFMFALTASAISLYILYAGIGALLLPFQIGLLAPGSKVAILSFFTSITVLIALFANPLAGAFSDRTTSRFGRRRPWILVGGLLTVVGLLFMWRATSIPLLFIGYCFVELFSNIALATLVATIPDQVPENQRGTVSGIFGLSTVLGGFLSDRLKRRKLFVIAGMCIMAISFLLLALFQSWIAVLVAAAVLGFGLGAYLAVDVAIVTLVLPSAKNRAKDMGIINIANTLPHSVAPVMAGFMLALTHNYSVLYIAATIFVLLGIFTVMPIKAVR